MGEWLEFFVGVVCGLSVAGILWIVIAPSRRARAETGIDPDLEAKVLLGEPPVPDQEPSSPEEEASPEHPRPYTDRDLQALRKLGRSKPRRR